MGLGVDGSASNDAGSLLHEARLACFLQRAKGDVAGDSRRYLFRVKNVFQRAAETPSANLLQLTTL